MTLDLTLRILTPQTSLHESIAVEVLMRNNGTRTYQLPNIWDNTAALTFTALDGDKSVRIMNTITKKMMRQGMRDRIPVDTSLLGLSPGETWQAKFDLGGYHYLLPPRVTNLSATFSYSPENIFLESGRVPVSITHSFLGRILLTRDNPVTDGLTVLLGESAPSGAVYLRLYNTASPLASWCSARIDGIAAETVVCCARPNYFDPESFDPFFERWVVFRENRKVSARKYAGGQATGDVFSGVLPKNGTLLPAAYATRDSAVHIFFLTPKNELQCLRLTSGNAETVFGYRLPSGGGLFRDTGLPLALGFDPHFIHVFLPERGVEYRRLTLDGNEVGRRRLFPSRLLPFSCIYDPVDKVVLSALWDGPAGRCIELRTADILTESIEWIQSHAGRPSQTGPEQDEDATASRRRESLLYVGTLELTGAIRELSFAVDRWGDYHMLISTSKRRLYYIAADRSPMLVAQGEERFFPHVMADDKVYLGFYLPADGFRFIEYRRVRNLPHFAEFDAI